jgi:hypothetical protein
LSSYFNVYKGLSSEVIYGGVSVILLFGIVPDISAHLLGFKPKVADRKSHFYQDFVYGVWWGNDRDLTATHVLSTLEVA